MYLIEIADRAKISKTRVQIDTQFKLPFTCSSDILTFKIFIVKLIFFLNNKEPRKILKVANKNRSEFPPSIDVNLRGFSVGENDIKIRTSDQETDS